jgi:hypothetical protein
VAEAAVDTSAAAEEDDLYNWTIVRNSSSIGTVFVLFPLVSLLLVISL